MFFEVSFIGRLATESQIAARPRPSGNATGGRRLTQFVGRVKVEELGCTEMQGFLFSPPRCVDEIIPLFRRFEAKAIAAETRRRA